MLSTKYRPQPIPGYPALGRQDTTYARGTDYGGNHLRGVRNIWHGGAVDVDGLIVGRLFAIPVDSKTSTSELALAMNTLSVLLWASPWSCLYNPGVARVLLQFIAGPLFLYVHTSITQ